MSKDRLAQFGLITRPERCTPTDAEALRYLDRCMVGTDPSEPHQYLRGKWPNISREEAERIERLWQLTRTRR